MGSLVTLVSLRRHVTTLRDIQMSLSNTDTLLRPSSTTTPPLSPLRVDIWVDRSTLESRHGVEHLVEKRTREKDRKDC